MTQTKAQLIDGKSAEIEFTGGSASAPAISFTGDTNTGIYSPGTDQVAISTNGTGRLFVDSSGRVGVGTTPSTVLHCSSTDATLTLQGTRGTGASATIGTGGANSQNLVITAGTDLYQRGATHLFQNVAGTTEYARFDSSGRLGLGTSSPGSLLHLNSGTSDLFVRLESRGANALESSFLFLTKNSAGTNTGGSIGHDGNTNTLYLTNDTSGGATQHVAIDSSGRVGVGTTSPGKKLQVDSADFDTALFKRTNSTGSATIFLSNTSDHGAALQSLGNGAGGFSIFTQTSGTITERMRIDSSGRLGIGTSSPGAPLEVAGASGANISIFRTNNATAANNAGGGFYGVSSATPSNRYSQFWLDADGANFSGSDYFYIQKNGNSGTVEIIQQSNAAMGFHTNGTRAITIDSSQRVGIGTTSPQALLDVSASAPELRISSSNTGQTSGSSVGKLSIYTSDATTPGGAGVVGFIEATSATSNGSDYQLLISKREGSGGGSNFINLGTSASGAISFGTNTSGAGTERARIDSSGRLLVGTSSSISGGDANALIQAAHSSGMNLCLGGTNSTVTTGNRIGEITFETNAGGSYASTAVIGCYADANQGSGDYPSRLVFSVTADGASSPTERMRIQSNGATLAFSSANYVFASVRTAAGDSLFIFRNNASSAFVGTDVCIVRADGDLENTNNSYGALSDIKLKENIVDASSQWDDVKALQVRKYNFKAATGYNTHTQIGLVAQEVELVSPGLVSESPDRDEDGNDLGTVTKSVNYSVLYMKAVKALQEAMERIETLEAKVAALESA